MWYHWKEKSLISLCRWWWRCDTVGTINYIFSRNSFQFSISNIYRGKIWKDFESVHKYSPIAIQTRHSIYNELESFNLSSWRFCKCWSTRASGKTTRGIWYFFFAPPNFPRGSPLGLALQNGQNRQLCRLECFGNRDHIDLLINL